MQLTISKWGNSLGLRIPATIADMLSLSHGDKVNYQLSDGALVIKKEKSTREMFEEFYGKPISELTEDDLGPGSELDWGNDVGGEVF